MSNNTPSFQNLMPETIVEIYNHYKDYVFARCCSNNKTALEFAVPARGKTIASFVKAHSDATEIEIVDKHFYHLFTIRNNTVEDVEEDPHAATMYADNLAAETADAMSQNNTCDFDPRWFPIEQFLEQMDIIIRSLHAIDENLCVANVYMPDGSVRSVTLEYTPDCICNFMHHDTIKGYAWIEFRSRCNTLLMIADNTSLHNVSDEIMYNAVTKGAQSNHINYIHSTWFSKLKAAMYM